jgi:hypothetical protein
LKYRKFIKRFIKSRENVQVVDKIFKMVNEVLKYKSAFFSENIIYQYGDVYEVRYYEHLLTWLISEG